MIVCEVVRAEADVLRLHVPVSDSAVVRVLQRTGALFHNVGSGGLVYAALLHDAVKHFAALAELHDEEHEFALLIGLQELADVRVVELLHDLRLLHEGRLLFVIEDDDLLDRHEAVLDLPILCDKNLSITARADLMCVNVVAPRDLRVHALRHEVLGLKAPPVLRAHSQDVQLIGSARLRAAHRRAWPSHEGSGAGHAYNLFVTWPSTAAVGEGQAYEPCREETLS
mmetsp:Transcript_85372/g.226641  ORF Transcript_85372/g.226641 Transcript_85372/m.226641 type:complete len:226 (+) Transcript_85372:1313-1990(+)